MSTSRCVKLPRYPLASSRDSASGQRRIRNAGSHARAIELQLQLQRFVPRHQSLPISFEGQDRSRYPPGMAGEHRSEALHPRFDCANRDTGAVLAGIKVLVQSAQALKLVDAAEQRVHRNMLFPVEGMEQRDLPRFFPGCESRA